ncbi:hypothetical protein D3C81_459910 [compost metagenome]
MARFQIITDNGAIGVCCAACGNYDMFQHNPVLLTCNRCGHTAPLPLAASVITEQVVVKYYEPTT